MNFERGKDPQESIGIGIKKNSIPMENLYLFSRVTYRNAQGFYNGPFNFNFKKRKWVSMKKILPLLNNETLSLNELIKYFRIAEGVSDYIIISKILDWILLYKIYIQIKRKPGARVILSDSWTYKEKSYNEENDITLSFIIDSDLDKVEDIKSRGDDIQGVIWKENVYPILLGDKKIRK